MTEKDAAWKTGERYPGTVKEIELARSVCEIELQGTRGKCEIKMDAGDMLKVEHSRSWLQKRGKATIRMILKRVKGLPVLRAQEEKTIGYERAKRIARSRFDGHIVEIQLDEDGGRRIYGAEMNEEGKRESRI